MTEAQVSDSTASAPKATFRLFAVNITLLLIALALTRYNCARLWSLQLPDLLSVKGALSAGGLTILTTLLPAQSRRRSLVLVRRGLDSRRASFICLGILVVTCLPLVISVLAVSWTGSSEITIKLNDHQRKLIANKTTGTTHTAEIYAPIAKTVRVDVGAFESVTRMAPFRHQSINLPFYATSEQSPRLARAESLILSTFFSLFDRHDLSDIREALDKIKPSALTSSQQVARLQRIRDVVDNAANSASTIDTKLALIDDFAETYPNDPWIALLNAQARYASSQFSQCATALDVINPPSVFSTAEAIYSTELFFRGVCKMKAVTAALRDPRPQRNELSNASRDMQAGVARLLNTSADLYLRNSAPISASIYEAICDFYSGNLKAAVDGFTAVADATSSGQKARALNNAGFAAFVLADYARADKKYSEAYEAQPNFPYIRANLAYLKLAEGDVASAHKTFMNIAQDVDLKQNNPQDVLLSKIMLLELDHDNGRPLSQINEGYADLLASRHAPMWEFQPNVNVRYALLIHEVIDRIYLGGDYFGLEMFALTSACRAQETDLQTNAHTPDRKSAAVNLQSDMQILKARVSSNWLTIKHSGWFAHLDNCVPKQRPS